MILIPTPWTITWGGVPLLAAGDYIADETSGHVEGRYQVIAPLRAAYQTRNARGNVSNGMNFRRVLVMATAWQARFFELTHRQAVGAAASATGAAPDAIIGQIVASGGPPGQWKLANCQCRLETRTAANRVFCTYTLQGGALTVETPGVDPGLAAPPSNNLVTDAGDNIVTDTGDTRVTVD